MIEYPGKKYYQGEVKNGRMDGFGEFFWGNEKKYIGNYKNDKRDGFGVFITKSATFPTSTLINDITNNDIKELNYRANEEKRLKDLIHQTSDSFYNRIWSHFE